MKLSLLPPSTVLLAAALASVSLGCGPSERPEDRFWMALTDLCGQAFEGRVVEGTEATDQAMADARLVMHVRSCEANEIRVPFHVGENRSRTWVITRTDTGLRLKHDHRHEDGSPDEVTEYGGDAQVTPRALSVDFPADEHTATIVPVAATNVWTISIEPGQQFTYALRRETSARRFRVDFDLTRPLEAPPAPW